MHWKRKGEKYLKSKIDRRAEIRAAQHSLKH